MNFAKALMLALALTFVGGHAMADYQVAQSSKKMMKKKKKKKMRKKRKKMKKMGARNYGMAGCGLSSLVFDDPEDYNVKWKMMVAVILNGLGGNQTSGITSGTSNCRHGSSMAQATDAFIAANIKSLEFDVARGQGESLTALGQLMGCKEVAPMARSLQTNYDKVFVNQEATAKKIRETLRSDSSVAASCKHLG